LGIAVPDRVRVPSAAMRAHWRWHEASESLRVKLAAELIEAKIHNQRLVARHQPGDNNEARDRLKALGQAALRAQTLERLRGLEGHAAHVYFAHWVRWIPSNLGFSRRTGRHAQDPINAVLNLLYTQLFRTCWLACLTEGLDPYLGVLHEGRDRYAALAADLQEPFRFLCDRLVLELVHKRQLTSADFARESKDGPRVWLKPEALKLILGAWEARLDARVRACEDTASYREHIYAQAKRLHAVVRGERSTLGAFRLKW
jgi:CRISPR-associated protein Cas1